MKVMKERKTLKNTGLSDNEFIQFTLSRKEHNQLFPMRKTNIFKRWEYYYNDYGIVIYRHMNLLAKVISSLGFPVYVLIEGIAEACSTVASVWRKNGYSTHYTILNPSKSFPQSVNAKDRTYEKISALIG